MVVIGEVVVDSRTTKTEKTSRRLLPRGELGPGMAPRWRWSGRNVKVHLTLLITVVTLITLVTLVTLITVVTPVTLITLVTLVTLTLLIT